MSFSGWSVVEMFGARVAWVSEKKTPSWGSEVAEARDALRNLKLPARKIPNADRALSDCHTSKRKILRANRAIVSA